MIYDYLNPIDKSAKERLKLLKQKFPKLDGYLVYSSRFGQAAVGTQCKELFKQFSKMFVNSKAKTEALDLLEYQSYTELTPTDIKSVDTKIEGLVKTLLISEDIVIAIVFNELNYDLISKLQQDDLVDRSLTPQSKASIDIILMPLTLADRAVCDT